MSLFSLTFIVFAVALILFYFLLPKRCQWVVLLVASFIFYLTGGWQGVFYVLVTITTQYILARLLQRENDAINREIAEIQADAAQKREIRKRHAFRKKLFVWISVLINIGILCFNKFANVAIEFVNDLVNAQLGAMDLLVPLGLSYYTFKAVGYVIDVYRGRVQAERNPFKLALFISYFPALVQGPIDRYEHLAHQLVAPHAFSYERLKFGAQRMLWGYIKKLVIADRIAVFVHEAIGNYATQGYEGFIVIIGVMLYAFQIYADFSGGIDIVTGLSEIFGISLTENFKRPFFAKGIAEYWQRWHITLGAWMRTYVFYPLSLSPAFTKLGKTFRRLFGERARRVSKLIAPAIASFIAFLLIGLWHGVGWKYFWWGFFMALFVSSGTLLETVYARMRGAFHIDKNSLGWRMFQVVRTFLIIAMLRFVTLAADMTDLFNMVSAAFTHFNPEVLFDGTLYTMGLDAANFWFMLISIGVLMFIDYLQEKGIAIRETIARQNVVVRWAIYYAAIFSLIIFGVYGEGYNAANFIYQGF